MKSRPATFTLLFCPSLFTLREFFDPKLKEFNNSITRQTQRQQITFIFDLD